MNAVNRARARARARASSYYLLHSVNRARARASSYYLLHSQSAQQFINCCADYEFTICAARFIKSREFIKYA